MFCCGALPHFHKHLFSFLYCLCHHLHESQHTASRVEYIAFAVVEAKEDTSPCIFGFVTRMNPYPLKTLHIHQQRQPSSESSAACDKDAVTTRWDSRLSNYFMPADDCLRHLRSQLSRCWFHRVAEPFGHGFFFIDSLCRRDAVFVSSLFW